MPFALCAAFCLISVSAAATPADDRAALSDLAALDLRVATIAYRLATRNVALCTKQVPQLGMTFHAAAQYGGSFRSEAAAMFGLGDTPGVLAVVAGSPAADAGIAVGDSIVAVGDSIVAVDGVAVAGTQVAGQSYDGVAKLEATIDAALTAPWVTLRLTRGGAARNVSMIGTPGCASRVQVEPGKKLNAYADGTYVKLTSSVAEYAADDSELASVIAHEMAHNILGHRALLDRQGRSRANIRSTEIAADLLSVKLVAGAGFDRHAPARFWQRFGKKTGAGIFSDGTHLRTKARVKLLEDAAALLPAPPSRAKARD